MIEESLVGWADSTIGETALTPNAHDVAAALLIQVGPVEAMQLQKLVYYSQAWHLALLDKPLFTDTIQAWRDGPVVPTLWDQHRGQRIVSKWPSGDLGKLSDAGAKVVSLVCQVYGRLSGDDLSELTHHELPWRSARGDLPDAAPSKAVIQPDAMKSFYRGRRLAGRDPADLVSGGLYGCVDPAIDAIERGRVLADLREEFRGGPALDGPGFPEPTESAFHARCGDGEPPRVRARLNRERPQRGRATKSA